MTARNKEKVDNISKFDIHEKLNKNSSMININPKNKINSSLNEDIEVEEINENLNQLDKNEQLLYMRNIISDKCDKSLKLANKAYDKALNRTSMSQIY